MTTHIKKYTSTPRDPSQTILDQRMGYHEGFSYKLLDGGYGLDTPLPDVMDIDESKMSVWVHFANGNRRDGVGDLLEVAGINTERHRMNPVVLFDHGKHVQMPIGISEDEGIYTVLIDPVTNSAKGNAFFYQGKGMKGISNGDEYNHALFCEQLFDLIAKRFIRAGSIGYQVISAKELYPDYDRGTPKGLHLLQVLMLEMSAVVMPANMDTVRKMLSMPKICGKPLSPYLVKSLRPYAPPKKAMVGPEGHEGYHKDLAEIRLRYRSTKNRRRKMKKSVSGSSVIYVSHKDLEEVKKLASQRGLEFKWVGTHSSGRERIKLTGDDSQIDDMAKRYGLPIPRKAVQKDKEMASTKEMNKKKKNFGADPGPTDTGQAVASIPDENEMDTNTEMEDSPDEPLGAQVLRQIYEDLKIIMEDYDVMMPQLEQEEVKKYVEDFLGVVEEHLSTHEEMFGRIYADLDALGKGDSAQPMPDESIDEDLENDGQEVADNDAGAVPATSGEEPEPTGEEVMEGMARKKSLISNLRLKYRKKGMCSSCSQDPCKCKSDDSKEKEEDAKKEDSKKEESKKEESKKEDKSKKDNVVSEEDKPGDEEHQDKPGEAEEPEKDGDDTPDYSRFEKALELYEKAYAKEAHSFLGELSSTQNFSDDHRFKSYHYHKLLDEMSGSSAVPPAYQLPPTAPMPKSMPGDPEWVQEEAEEPQHKFHPHRKMCGYVSKFFHKTSQERAYGDPHRAEAMICQKMLDEVVAENMEEGEENSPDIESGDVDEKSLNEEYDLRQSRLEELERSLKLLSSIY